MEVGDLGSKCSGVRAAVESRVYRRRRNGKEGGCRKVG